jgi:REP element-mobilizing transposase RayT
LGKIIRAFKSISAIAINRLIGRTGQPLWQRNYFERIIRDEAELNNARQYIADNPARWAEDEENPANRLDGTS